MRDARRSPLAVIEVGRVGLCGVSRCDGLASATARLSAAARLDRGGEVTPPTLGVGGVGGVAAAIWCAWRVVGCLVRSRRRRVCRVPVRGR